MPDIQGMGNSVQLLGTMPAKVCAFWIILAEQAVGVFVAAALPRALRVAKVDLKTCIDLKLRMLCHLGHLVPGQ